MPTQPALAFQVLRLFVVFLAIFTIGVLVFSLPSIGGRLTLSLMPSGVAVALTYRLGRRVWPAVFAAGVAIDLWIPQPLFASMGVGAGLAAGAWLSAWLLEQGGFHPSFSRAKDVVIFFMAVAAGMTLAPTLGLAGFYLSGLREFASNPIYWIRWWGNSTSGALLIVPILVAFGPTSFRRFRENWIGAGLWTLGLAMCCASILLAPGTLGRPLIVLFAIMLIVVSAIRFGLVIAASASFAIAMMTAISAAFSVGAFAEYNQMEGLVTIWSFTASLSGLSLIITALLGERDAAGFEALRAEQRYAQVFNGTPQPLWVHARDSSRFLLVNDAAIRQYGWSREEFLARGIQVLRADPRRPVVPRAPDPTVTAEPLLEPFETQHIGKHGNVLEVEVWTQSIDCGGQPGELVFAVDVTERRAFGQALMDAIGGEQRRIAQEMHDGLGQELTGLALSVRALANRAQREREAISFDLDQLALLASSCIQDAHRIVQGLSPLTNADGNLDTALEALARRSSLSGIDVRFVARHEAAPFLELKIRNHLYRIAQEAVQNALKHSGARHIEIELASRTDDLKLMVTDDGHGLSAAPNLRSGLGMRTMRFRASAIGGKLSFSQNSAGGNSVVCIVPGKPSFAEAPDKVKPRPAGGRGSHDELV